MRAAPLPRRASFLAAALAALLAAGVYLGSLDNPFVYDDLDTVVANPSLVDVSNLRFVLTHSPFRPVVNASYAIDRAVWGPEPFGFHLTSLLLHIAAVVLLYFVVLRALREARVPAAQPNHRVLAAFAAASLFAVHPMMTEAVGYVSGRSEVLSAAWFLAALLLAMRTLSGGGRAAGIGAVACGLLALGSKETAVALPVVVLAYDWLVRPGGDEPRRRRLWRVHLPILAALAAAGLYRLSAVRGMPDGVGTGSMLLDGLTQARVIWRYLGLLAWPQGQSIMHAAGRTLSAADVAAWLALAGLALVAVAAVRVRRSYPLVTLGVLWWFAVLAPSSSIIPLREVMAEHRVYLAVPGLLLAIAAVVPYLLAALTRRVRPAPAVFAIALGVVLACLAVLTVNRNRVWRSPVVLWADAASRATEMWEPHYALADAMRESRDCASAMTSYRRVLALRPAHRDAHINLGICLAETGELAEAERAFHRALEIDPAFVRGYTNLGALALLAGDVERARDYYREAIVRDPDNVLARIQLAGLYERTFGDYHAAARMCGEVRLLAPETPGVVECVERNQRLAAEKDAGRLRP